MGRNPTQLWVSLAVDVSVPSVDSIEVGRRVRAVRAYSGMRAENFADAAGLTYRTLRKVESGERLATREQLQAFSAAAGLRVEFFDVDFDALEHDAAVALLTTRLNALEDRLIRIEGMLGRLVP